MSCERVTLGTCSPFQLLFPLSTTLPLFNYSSLLQLLLSLSTSLSPSNYSSFLQLLFHLSTTLSTPNYCLSYSFKLILFLLTIFYLSVSHSSFHSATFLALSLILSTSFPSSQKRVSSAFWLYFLPLLSRLLHCLYSLA